MGVTDFFDDDLQRRAAVRTAPLGQATDVVGGVKGDDFPARPISDLNLTRMARHREEMNTQVATAKVEIERMKRRQSDLEREQHAIESLMEKQDQYERGKAEMIQCLSESVVSLQKMEDQAARQVEIYSSTRARFGECIEELHRMNDADWADEVFREELNKAVMQIDVVRKEFVKGQAAVEAAGGPVRLFDETRPRASAIDEESGMSRGFAAWAKIGLAVSTPLIIAMALAVAILILLK
jgi:hypothetical protein